MPINDPKTCPFKRSHRFTMGTNSDDIYVQTHKKCAELDCKDQLESCISDSFLTFAKQPNSNIPQEKATIEHYDIYVNSKPKSDSIEQP